MGCGATRASLVAANAQFYRAFESLRPESMAAVWLKDEAIYCIHPGWDLLVGWEAVMESWERILANTRYIEIGITDVQTCLADAIGVVVCREHIVSCSTGEPTRGSALATNAFYHVEEAWRLVHHHAG